MLLFKTAKNLNAWLNPYSQVKLIVKWHLGYAYCKLFGYTAKTLSSAISIKPQKVLIVGTGPSAANFDLELLDKYDCAVAINHALLHPTFKICNPSQQVLIWFSGDGWRLEQLSSEVINDKKWVALFGCADNREFLKIMYSRHLRERIYMIKSKHFWERYVNLILFGYPYISIHPSLPRYLKSFDKSLIHGATPGSHLSSAIGALNLFAALGAQQIDLIGCDFNASRAPLFSELGNANFDNSCAKLIIESIQGLLVKYSIQVRNLSWS